MTHATAQDAESSSASGHASKTLTTELAQPGTTPALRSNHARVAWRPTSWLVLGSRRGTVCSGGATRLSTILAFWQLQLPACLVVTVLTSCTGSSLRCSTRTVLESDLLGQIVACEAHPQAFTSALMRLESHALSSTTSVLPHTASSPSLVLCPPAKSAYLLPFPLSTPLFVFHCDYRAALRVLCKASLRSTSHPSPS